jgi:STE24 endopeptidase
LFNFAGLALVLVVFLSMPFVVRLVLGLRSMEPGPLRSRLDEVARRLRFRCSDILIWNTRKGMANAMVVGILPWPRYVVFTDRLLHEFTADEVEAVFGHEIGHVKHFHMLYYFLFLSLSMVVLGVLAHLFLSRFLNADQQHLEALPMAGLVLVYIFVVFGFISRRCERQADIYGCRTVSCGLGNCQAHETGLALAPCATALCPTGIRTFIRALEKVAEVNGISRDRPGLLQSWQHSTIARRVAFLQQMITDPGIEPLFQRHVAFVKWGLFAVLGLLFAAVLVTGSLAFAG